MSITIDLIKEYVEKCSGMISKCFPDFKKPQFDSIKITRARSFWGSVYAKPNGCYELKISNVFDEIKDKDLFSKRLTSCVVHEIIHTLPGCMNHGKNFKARCNVFNEMFPGFDVQTRTAMCNYGVRSEPKKVKFRMIGEKCYKSWDYMRTPTYPVSDYSCSKCGHGTLFLEKVTV